MTERLQAPAGAGEQLRDGVEALYRLVDSILVEGGVTALDPELIQRINTLGVKLYHAGKEAGALDRPVLEGDAVTATEAAVFCSDVLRAVNLDLFELSLWRGMTTG